MGHGNRTKSFCAVIVSCSPACTISPALQLHCLQMRRTPRKPSPAFLQASQTGISSTGVSETVLRQGRQTGQLNLSNRGLEEVPRSVWRINVDPPSEASMAFDTRGDDRWWDQSDLTKLILATNKLSQLSEEISLLSALVVLDVHSNQLSSLPSTIGRLGSLTKLVLSHNCLTSLPPSLTRLEHLQQLKLDHNQLTVLPDDMAALTHLDELDLSHNSLSSLPPELGGLDRLMQLVATHNRLCDVPASLGRLARLKELALANNKLTDFPPLEGMICLQTLDLRYNSLTELPLIHPAPELKELHLGANKLHSLSVARLSPLTSLRLLDLRDNRLQCVPEEITQVHLLERLDLSNNDLPGLPYVMGLMPDLKSVQLDGNPLKGLRRDIVQRGTVELLKYLRSRIQPDTPSEHPSHHSTKFTPTKQPPPSHSSLTPAATARDDDTVVTISSDAKSLSLTKRNFTALPEKVFECARLTELSIGYNRLVGLPPAIKQLTALTILDIRNNQLSSLPGELECCVELRDVVLSFNRLTSIPPVLYRLAKLENLLADDNQISSIEVEGLQQLPALSCLDLKNNNIGKVPVELGTFTTLRHLQLSGNPFRNPRPAILSRGTPALLQYLRDRIPT